MSRTAGTPDYRACLTLRGRALPINPGSRRKA